MAESCPFKMPIRYNEGSRSSLGCLVSADHELICETDGATHEEVVYLVRSVNMHQALVEIASELVKWERDPDHYGGDLADLARRASALLGQNETACRG